jgi:LmbE family N-acetylglucosaminyl deacetylase
MLGFKLNNSKPLNILCLGAHCDDIEIGAGGTLLKMFDEYEINSVKWVVFASNNVRKNEATISAKCFLEKVSNKDILIYSFNDGFLPFIASEIKQVFEMLKTEFAPDIIFTHYRNDRHQDHRLVSDLTWNTWRNHQILEYEIPKYDGDLGIPNFYVPLDVKYIKQKNNILMEAFESQASKHWFNEDIFNSIARIRGMESANNYAEAFFARKIVF